MEIVAAVTEETTSLGKVNHLARGRYYCFYKGNPTTKSIFAALLLAKSFLKVRIRADPNTFRDPKGTVRAKVYKGWFYKQNQEREFKITDKDQIEYAMQLIKQSYDLAR